MTAGRVTGHDASTSDVLSISQERQLYFETLAARQGQPAAFNFVECRRVTGTLDPASFRAAFRAVMGRHAVLRSRIQPAGIGAAEYRAAIDEFARLHVVTRHIYRQTVADDCDVDIPLTDLRHFDAPQQRRLLRQACFEHSLSAFDYSAPPLIRATVYALAPSEHAVLLSAPHFAMDAWSLRLFWSDLELHYTELTQRGRLPEFPATPSYHDHTARQERDYAEGRFDQSMAYWSEQWCRATHVGLDDFDFVRPWSIGVSLGTGVEHHELPGTVSVMIRRAARTLGVTPPVVFLAAFALWAYRHTGCQDLAIWLPFANRRLRSSRGRSDGLPTATR